MKGFAVLSLAAAVLASPCPYGQLAEAGQLSKKEAEHFYTVRAEGESAVEAHIAKREAEHNHFKRQEEYYTQQVKRGDLLLGGGLLNGILQPFTGILQALDVPV
jgi:ABC-type glycerol-3-phosphate transport system substrate-binding protein